jgi:hypothetical protein
MSATKSTQVGFFCLEARRRLAVSAVFDGRDARSRSGKFEGASPRLPLDFSIKRGLASAALMPFKDTERKCTERYFRRSHPKGL